MLQEENRSYANNARDLLIRATCVICLEVFGVHTVTIVARCGHVCCMNCMFRSVNGPNTTRRCAVDLPAIGSLTRVFFRFNIHSQIICRRCGFIIREDTPIYDLRCGDIYCDTCSVGLAK